MVPGLFEGFLVFGVFLSVRTAIRLSRHGVEAVARLVVTVDTPTEFNSDAFGGALYEYHYGGKRFLKLTHGIGHIYYQKRYGNRVIVLVDPDRPRRSIFLRAAPVEVT